MVVWFAWGVGRDSRFSREVGVAAGPPPPPVYGATSCELVYITQSEQVLYNVTLWCVPGIECQLFET